jgi:3-deoxy-D-manno-octulosonate 8-phosphate phosphatase (KDO 8-P phosphatase)
MTRTPLLAPAFPVPGPVLGRARSIRLVLFDVDGVLTDGRIILGSQDEYKAFDIKDGHGMKMLQRSGIEIGMVTGRTSRAVERRAAELGIRHVYQGCGEKLPVCRKLLEELKLTPEQVAYVGDDVVDLPVLLHVGLSIAVQDAHPVVKHHVHWTTPSAGGRGAARDVCELIMHAQGEYEPAMRRHLSTPNSSQPAPRD